MFFGDFTNSALQAEIGSIREITNDIIDTQNPSPNIKKDFTDFIMLDYIYRTADEDQDIDACVLFTGDGHFSSAAKYLKMKKKKKVIIYAVRGSFSNQLKAIADEAFELPVFTNEQLHDYRIIVDNFDYLRSKEKTGSRPVYPTFKRTVSTIAGHNNISIERAEKALKELIDNGIVVVTPKQFDYGKTINVLSVDWEKAVEAEIWKK